VGGQPAGVSGEKQQVGVTTVAMGAMPGMCASVGSRQITDAKGVAARKSIGYFTRRSLDRAHQRWRAESGALAGTEPSIAIAPILQVDRVTEVSVVRGTHRDRLPHGQGLAHARTDRCDYDYGENPKHSKCMIAHGSA
jgi:hypothetical protein